MIGFSLLSQVYNTYSAFFFVNLKPWSERKSANEQYAAIQAHLAAELGKIPDGVTLRLSAAGHPRRRHRRAA